MSKSKYESAISLWYTTCCSFLVSHTRPQINLITLNDLNKIDLIYWPLDLVYGSYALYYLYRLFQFIIYQTNIDFLDYLTTTSTKVHSRSQSTYNNPCTEHKAPSERVLNNLRLHVSCSKVHKITRSIICRLRLFQTRSQGAQCSVQGYGTIENLVENRL